MSTRKVQLSSTAWVAVTQAGEVNGSLLMSKGTAVFTEAAALPTTSIEETPLLDKVTAGKRTQFYGVGASDLIYAIAVTPNATVDVSPSGA